MALVLRIIQLNIHLLRTPSRIFIGPDGLEYKWKVVLEGTNPVFPDSSFRVLYCKDSKHPIATTARFVQRDGEYNVSGGYGRKALVFILMFHSYFFFRTRRILSTLLSEVCGWNHGSSLQPPSLKDGTS